MIFFLRVESFSFSLLAISLLVRSAFCRRRLMILESVSSDSLIRLTCYGTIVPILFLFSTSSVAEIAPRSLESPAPGQPGGLYLLFLQPIRLQLGRFRED